MNSYDPLIDLRSRIQREQQEALERRSQALIDQSSPDSSPAVRVRVWERLHQVRLPSDPEHTVLLIVAQQTGLSLGEVLEVQRQRLEPPAA